MRCDPKNIMSTSHSDIVPDTSMSLIRRVQSGDEQAWIQFVHIYSPLIYSKCRSKNLNAHDSVEILQEVFYRVHTSIQRFTPTKENASFRSWLRTVAGNVVVDHFRTLKERHKALDSATLTLQLNSLSKSLLTREPDSDSVPQYSETQMIVAQAMQQVRMEFETRTWQAFWRFAIDGMPAKEVGDELGMSEGAVRQAKLAVKKRLKTELDGLIDEC